MGSGCRKIAFTLIMHAFGPILNRKGPTLEWGTNAVELRSTGQPTATAPTPTCYPYLAGIRSNLPEVSV